MDILKGDLSGQLAMLDPAVLRKLYESRAPLGRELGLEAKGIRPVVLNPGVEYVETTVLAVSSAKDNDPKASGDKTAAQTLKPKKTKKAVVPSCPRTPLTAQEVLALDGCGGTNGKGESVAPVSLRPFAPSFVRPRPPILQSWYASSIGGAGLTPSEALEGTGLGIPLNDPDVMWLNPTDTPGLLWDASMCEDTSRGAEVRELMAKAFRGPLIPQEQEGWVV